MKKRRFFVAIDFSRYRGKYVAIVQRRVVASGYDAERVWQKVKRKYPGVRPELLKVSKGETLVLIVCGRLPLCQRKIIDIWHHCPPNCAGSYGRKVRPLDVR